MAIVVALFMTTTQHSFALFFTSFQEQFGVSSASAENLIKNVKVTEKEDKSLVIEIMRDSEYGYRPDVGFALEGDIQQYILHINPVKIDKNGIYHIPIVPNINMHQFWELTKMKILQNKKSINGSVILKNFDGKVIEQQPIKIDINYLLSRINEDMIKSGTELKQIVHEDEVRDEIVIFINELASTMNWEDSSLTEEKNSILRVIAPNLIGQLDTLENERQTITEENERLKKEKEELERKSAELQSSLNEQIQGLEDENEQLRKKLEELEKAETSKIDFEEISVESNISDTDY